MRQKLSAFLSYEFQTILTKIMQNTCKNRFSHAVPFTDTNCKQNSQKQFATLKQLRFMCSMSLPLRNFLSRGFDMIYLMKSILLTAARHIYAQVFAVFSGLKWYLFTYVGASIRQEENISATLSDLCLKSKTRFWLTSSKTEEIFKNLKRYNVRNILFHNFGLFEVLSCYEEARYAPELLLTRKSRNGFKESIACTLRDSCSVASMKQREIAYLTKLLVFDFVLEYSEHHIIFRTWQNLRSTVGFSAVCRHLEPEILASCSKCKSE